MLGGKGRTLVLMGVFLLASGFAFKTNYLIIMGMFVLTAPFYSLPWFDSSLNIADLKVERILESKSMFRDSFLHVKVKITNMGGSQFNFIDIFDEYNTETFQLVVGENYISTRINPHQTITFSYILAARVRGQYQLGPLNVVVKDKLGFNAEERIVPNSIDDILIYPAYDIINKLDAMAQQESLNKTFGIHRSRIKGIGDEFYGMRKYVYGDQFRSIDWKASVRTQELIVKEFETDKSANVIIFLDASESMAGGAIENTKFEYSVQAAMLLSKVALNHKDNVGIATFSDAKHFRFMKPIGTSSGFFQLLNFMATVMPRKEKQFFESCEEFTKHYRDKALIIILSDLESSKEDIVKGIKKLRSYGNAVVVIAPFSPWFEVHELDLSPADKALAEAISEEMMQHILDIKPELDKLLTTLISVGPDDILSIVLAEYARARKLGMGEK
ncbi:MAG: DUF58 domain-containing protein [Promethearchaeota archaeon]